MSRVLLSLWNRSFQPANNSYYHIGITFSFSNELERANDCFRSAIQVIEDRISNLKAAVQAAGGLTTPEMVNKEKEVLELEKLLPEMAAKIEDSQDQQKAASEVAKTLGDEESKDSQVVAKIHESPSKPVNDISHLVKRKTRETPETNGAVKKLCTTHEGEGDAVVNGKNGDLTSTPQE